MKKLFISQPMNGKNEKEIIATREAIIKKASEELGDDVEVIDSYFKEYNPQNGCIPLKYLAKSLELLADADILILGEGWECARGCRMEFSAAKSYGIAAYETNEFGRFSTVKNNPIVKLNGKEPIHLIADLHISPYECYIIHGSAKSENSVTRFEEGDIEFINL